MNTTAKRKPTRRYVTTNGKVIEATRLNPEHPYVYGREYAITVDGVRVQVMHQDGRNAFSWPGQTRSWLTEGGITDRLLVSVAWDHLGL